jgi:GH25 family lysozyme M1 (1,4-beta-N-acetylmuramidase)
MSVILDISHHQVPSKIDYDKLANQVALAIVRTQYGSNLIDTYYKTHHLEFRKRGIPTAAYAWLRGVSVTDMEQEATDFFSRTKAFNPTFWFLDVEEKSMSDMRKGTSAFLSKLRTLGAKKVGIYVGHHLYKSFNLDLSEADAVWIPHYGKNDGTSNSMPAYPCDLHQYTDKGKLQGYNGHLDLNRIISDKKLAHFTSGQVVKKPSIVVQPKAAKPVMKKPTTTPKPKTSEIKKTETYKVVTAINGYTTADNAKSRTKKVTTVGKGTYYIFNESAGMVNVTKDKKKPGSWINPADNQVKNAEKAVYHVVKTGDAVSQLAVKYGSSQAQIKSWNKLMNINLIYVGQRLRVK